MVGGATQERGGGVAEVVVLRVNQIWLVHAHLSLKIFWLSRSGLDAFTVVGWIFGRIWVSMVVCAHRVLFIFIYAISDHVGSSLSFHAVFSSFSFVDFDFDISATCMIFDILQHVEGRGREKGEVERM